MTDKRKPVPQAGYFASDGSFLHLLYAKAVLKQLKPQELSAVLASLGAMK